MLGQRRRHDLWRMQVWCRVFTPDRSNLLVSEGVSRPHIEKPRNPINSRTNIILADLVEELPAADPQPFGGPRAIAAAGEQGAEDRPTLDLGEQGAEGQRLTGVAGRRQR